ncbi:MAG: hypothetical protein NT029_09435 [Armatimonadetes bacterium]|nr:hypothetical protein [Armatimonadota bacterium]
MPVRVYLPLLAAFLPVAAAGGQSALPSGGWPLLAPDALFAQPVGGLERTGSAASTVDVAGAPFRKALRVTLARGASESNATQLCVPIAAPARRGDVAILTLYLRGRTEAGKPAKVEALFERSRSPWTKSLTRGASAARQAGRWRRIVAPFQVAEDIDAGDAMVSIRLALGAQTVELADLQVTNYGKTRTLEEVTAMAMAANPLGDAPIRVLRSDRRQVMVGLGGNFCQPRYGRVDAMDAVGERNLQALQVAHARVGLPLNHWAPERGREAHSGPALAALEQLQRLSKLKVPIVVSIWEGPQWLLGGSREQSGRVLPREKYTDCIEAIASFLVAARDRFGVTVDYLSFNEPDYGVNFKFAPAEMAEFIRLAGKLFSALELKTRFVVADTANGAAFPAYAGALLADKGIAPYLGPLAFHCWDALSAPDETYAAIGEVGRRSGKPVWCLEAGHDSALWEKPNPWISWDNGLLTALAYAKTVALTRAAVMDYWTYQDNYPLASSDGKQAYPVFHVIRQMQDVLGAGRTIVGADAEADDLRVAASVGKGGDVALLVVNPIGPGRALLTGLPAGASARVTVSDSHLQRSLQPGVLRTSAQGALVVALPGRSVVTVEVK